MTDAASPLHFTRGPAMANRFMLAPLTNLQSHVDGTLSDDEMHWLEMRAKGGFALVMTAAAHVQRAGDLHTRQPAQRGLVLVRQHLLAQREAEVRVFGEDVGRHGHRGAAAGAGEGERAGRAGRIPRCAPGTDNVCSRCTPTGRTVP